ncbi:heavy-metal-associated domain-containing protein [Clostridium rectalis]|uniref:heavy-metal-associated domain-containing protein n=1 Tax=Clostridium rectalis TaxID=2040295 RepID=UPI000F637CC7|nr:cation transporter [Clostridium rectalis]
MFFKKNNEKEIKLKVKGMMCPHCELTVKKAITSIEGVKKAKVSYIRKSAVVVLKEGFDIPVNILIEAVKSIGYDVFI